MTHASGPWREGRLRFSLLLGLVATSGALPLGAQGLPRYDAAQLACVVFGVRVTTTVTTDMQGAHRVEEVRRDGRLVVRGTAVDSGIALEAWWDSLALSRRTGDQTLTPDAAGVLGGRYRGLLRPDGRFVRTDSPWVPDEVAEVSDLSVALDDLFPVDSGVTVHRLGDSAGVERFRVQSSRSVDSAATDDRPFAVYESETSDGVVLWGAVGLIGWDRRVQAETRVKESPQRAFRSVADQRIVLRRVGNCTGN